MGCGGIGVGRWCNMGMTMNRVMDRFNGQRADL